MVEHPAEYPWSCHRANARGEAGHLPLTAHSLYFALGNPVFRDQVTAALGRRASRGASRGA